LLLLCAVHHAFARHATTTTPNIRRGSHGGRVVVCGANRVASAITHTAIP
jgi:hypothetical protein